MTPFHTPDPLNPPLEPSSAFCEFDRLMMEGYDQLKAGQVTSACDTWLRAWDRFLVLYAEAGRPTLQEFDRWFQGGQFVSNWVQDFEMELRNAGMDQPIYHEHRRRYCEALLEHIPSADAVMVENMHRVIAESWADVGRRDRSDALFEQWLTAAAKSTRSVAAGFETRTRLVPSRRPTAALDHRST